MTATSSEADVIFRRDGALGRVTLNRPKALNALTLGMCAAMLRQLHVWAADPAIRAVMIDAVPGRAFCAGGDIRAIYDLGKKRDPLAREFFTTEYRLNATIKHYPKRYVAVIDGIAMGGGMGVSIHGSHLVASENALMAMPETALGLFPDVGGSFFLPRLPGEIGMYLALTGERLTAPDMVYAGIATHFVPSSALRLIAPRLAEGELAHAVLADLAADSGPPSLAIHRNAIDRAFSASSVEAILQALQHEGPWGRGTADLIATRSPTSLKLTYRLMREGRWRRFENCMRVEYRVMMRLLESHDFYEGIRATVIDKDQRPQWQPADLSAVGHDDIERYFAPLGEAEWRL